MKFAITAKFLPQTKTMPSRFKFSNGYNTITDQICIDGSLWCEAEDINQKQIDTVKELAVNFAKIKLQWNYKEYAIAMIKSYPVPVYAIVPIGEELPKIRLSF